MQVFGGKCPTTFPPTIVADQQGHVVVDDKFRNTVYAFRGQVMPYSDPIPQKQELPGLSPRDVMTGEPPGAAVESLRGMERAPSHFRRPTQIDSGSGGGNQTRRRHKPLGAYDSRIVVDQ